METSGIDIFATKGIEYILILCFLLLLTFFWRLLYRSTAPANAHPAGDKPDLSMNHQFRLAEGYYFHSGHSWAVPEKQDVVRVGIDDFAQQLLGKPDAVELPGIGTHLKQNENGWKLKIDSKTIDILSPISGEVISVNEEVIENPSLINQDPYGSGWLLKVRVTKMDENLGSLLSGEQAVAWTEEAVWTLSQKMDGDFENAIRNCRFSMTGIAKSHSLKHWERITTGFFR